MDGDKAGLAFDRAPLRAGGGQREAKKEKKRGEDEA